MTKRRILIGCVALIALTVALIGVSKAVGKKGEYTKVDVAKVARAPFTVTVTASGSVEAENDEEVHSSVTGRVTGIIVEEGEQVHSGQTLIVLDDSDLNAAYQQARATLATAQADLVQLKGTVKSTNIDDNLEVRQAAAQLSSAEAKLAEVKKGATEAQLAQARSTLSQAETTLNDAKAERDRNQRLFTAGAVPRRQLEDSVNRVGTAESAYQAALKSFEDVKNGPTFEQLQMAQAGADQARAALALARDHASTKGEGVRAAEARVRQAQANLKAVEQQVAGARIVSPSDGTVTSKIVTDGQAVVPGALVMKVADLREVLIKAKVEEADIDKVRVGQSVTVTADAAVGVQLPGKVTKIAPQAIIDANVVKFEVEIATENRGQILKPGMTADVDIVTYHNPRALIVPIQAIVERPIKEPAATKNRQAPVATTVDEPMVKAVYVVRSGVARRVNVELGPAGVTNVEIKGGLKAGDILVTGDYKALKALRDGDRVKTGDQTQTATAKK